MTRIYYKIFKLGALYMCERCKGIEFRDDEETHTYIDDTQVDEVIKNLAGQYIFTVKNEHRINLKYFGSFKYIGLSKIPIKDWDGKDINDILEKSYNHNKREI